MNPWHLWAKVRKNEDGTHSWHALPWHLLEVGAVAQQLWEVSIPQHTRNRICTRLGLTDSDACQFFGFLAALHDIGKASPRFQSMNASQVQRLKSLYGSDFREDTVKTALRHSLISWGLLVPLFKENFGWTPRISMRYAEITAAHHGRFWNDQEYETLSFYETLERTGQLTWGPLHRQLFQDIAGAFGIDTHITHQLNALMNSDASFPTYEDSLWLAGLISVADWIGSDERYFPYNADQAESWQTALKTSHEKAKKALRLTGWESPPLSIASGTFEDTILTIDNLIPNQAQMHAVEITRNMTKPGMTIIEIPMGWGKTEIALWIAANYAETEQITGTYFAMPTMATSDQLHQRVQAHLTSHVKATDRTRIVPLHLLHGMAEFSAMEEMESTIGEDSLEEVAGRLATQNDPDADRGEELNSVVRRARWFTRKKHGLLARYGVGTVDQALMSVLLNNHMFVRMFGLSGKTIVFDEVHSYDVYMSSLFDRLLEFLGALGSPVVILSATLPQDRTKNMLQAYANGARWTVHVNQLASYPRITAIDDTQVQSVTVAPNPDDTPVTIHLEWMFSTTETMWDELATRLNDELRDGGTVAVICNTVSAAQECFSRLQQEFEPDNLTLFHARFRQKDRANIQDEVLERFGKDAGNRRPHKHIVVATQVVEQSLDLDFDFMVSMFAPTDLLLQRAGRLQRHRKWDKTRPQSFRGRPRLLLIGLENPDAKSGPDFHKGSQKVYGEYVLLRSWLALAQRNSISIPSEVEEVIEVTYGADSPFAESMQNRYEIARNTWLDKTMTEKSVSESVLLHELDKERTSTRTDVLLSLGQVRNDPDEEPEAHRSRLALTRLGPPAISLVILKREDLGKLGFDPIGDPATPFTNDQIRRLLKYSVTVSNHQIVRSALAMNGLPAWEESAHLRHRRLILLDTEGSFNLNRMSINLDDHLGVVTARIDQDSMQGVES